jgi:hypothetical protein
MEFVTETTLIVSFNGKAVPSLFPCYRCIWSVDHIIRQLLLLLQSRDSSVGIATGYGLDDQVVGFLHVVQTGSGVHPGSYPMGTGSSFPGAKAARA